MNLRRPSSSAHPEDGKRVRRVNDAGGLRRPVDEEVGVVVVHDGHLRARTQADRGSASQRGCAPEIAPELTAPKRWSGGGRRRRRLTVTTVAEESCAGGAGTLCGGWFGRRPRMWSHPPTGVRYTCEAAIAGNSTRSLASAAATVAAGRRSCASGRGNAQGILS